MTEPLSRNPETDVPTGRTGPRRRLRGFAKPLIAASQPGLMKEAEENDALDVDALDTEALDVDSYENDVLDVEALDADVAETDSYENDEIDIEESGLEPQIRELELDDADQSPPAQTVPKPPTRPTRPARPVKAKAKSPTPVTDDTTNESDAEVDVAPAGDAATANHMAGDASLTPRFDPIPAGDTMPEPDPTTRIEIPIEPPVDSDNGPQDEFDEEPEVESGIEAETAPEVETGGNAETSGEEDEAVAPVDSGSLPASNVAPSIPPLPAPAVDADPAARLAARATTPELGQLELRQIAGLTAGVTMRLDPERYDFSENPNGVGFQIEVDRNDRALVIPGDSEIKVDTEPVTAPTLIGSGVLDVGSARFLVRHRREHKRATDWLDQYDSIDRPEPLIEVPANLGAGIEAAPEEEKPKRRKRRNKKEVADQDPPRMPKLDVTSWEFVERVRSIRVELTDRERYLHADPAELAERAIHRAPILGIRPPGHPLFGKVGVLVADMPWMPRFDDISAIPDSLGPYLKPLMSLPSLPIAADLLVGPLGIVGSRNATLACARHIMTSLYGLSTADLHLHVVAGTETVEAWDWSLDIAPERALNLESSFPVAIVDGMDNFAASGLSHADAIEHRAGLVILAESVEDLPAYCGTVLQVDRAGGGLLTNHLGHIIAGTPIGTTTDFAATVADNLRSVMERRHSR